jgi:aspartate racemase
VKTLGIIGGIAPESTIDYYRRIIALYRSRVADGSYPPIIINSIDLQHMIGLVAAKEMAALTDLLTREVERLAAAGAAFALFASNTPHIVFDDVRSRSPIPLLSIVETTCAEARKMRVRKVGLIGTRFTMQGHFYPEVFSRNGIEVIAPYEDEQTWIHDKYMTELVNAAFLDETRTKLLTIIDRMRERDHIEALILGGTELPLILRDAGTAVPFVDTTRIHTEAAVEEMLG